MRRMRVGERRIVHSIAARHANSGAAAEDRRRESPSIASGRVSVVNTHTASARRAPRQRGGAWQRRRVDIVSSRRIRAAVSPSNHQPTTTRVTTVGSFGPRRRAAHCSPLPRPYRHASVARALRVVDEVEDGRPAWVERVGLFVERPLRHRAARVEPAAVETTWHVMNRELLHYEVTVVSAAIEQRGSNPSRDSRMSCAVAPRTKSRVERARLQRSRVERARFESSRIGRDRARAVLLLSVCASGSRRPAPARTPLAGRARGTTIETAREKERHNDTRTQRAQRRQTHTRDAGRRRSREKGDARPPTASER